MCLPCVIAASFVRGDAGAPSPFPHAAQPFPWGDLAPCGVGLRWTGVAGFVLDAGGARIAFDPFVSRPSAWRVVLCRWSSDAAAVVRAFSGLDAVFVGHTHYDHAMDLATVAAASPRARIVGSRTTVEACRRLGVAEERLVAVEDGSEQTVGPFRVRAVASRHGVVPLVSRFDRFALPRRGLPRTALRWPRGEVFAWRVETAGRAFHVQGSAGIDDDALARQGPADVLVACAAARRGTPDYLARLCARLRPRVLVPCHHDDMFRALDRPPAPIATLRWPAFLAEAAAQERAHGTRLWLPVRGARADL